MCTIGIIIVISIILSKNNGKEKVALFLLFLLTSIQFISCVMSGFGECYGIWELVINMYFAFLAVMYWDKLYNLSIVQKTGITIVFIGLCFIAKAEGIIEHQMYSITLNSYVILLMMLVVVLSLAKRIKSQKVIQIVMFGMFVISYFTICYNWRGVARDRDISVLQEREAVEELLCDVDESTFCRIDNERGFAEPRTGMNISLSQDYPGVMEYVSIENNSYIWAFDKWGISYKDHNILGLDQRAILETLCNVKYFVVRSKYDFLSPYGFEYVKSTEDGEWDLYQNSNSLPILYGYSSVVDSDLFAQMNGLKKQNYMLNATSVEKYDGNVPKIELTDDHIGQTEYNINVI